MTPKFYDNPWISRPFPKRAKTIKAVSIPAELHALAMSQVRALDLDFSNYVRRLIRRDIANPINLEAFLGS